MFISDLAELVPYNAIFKNFSSSLVLASCFSTFEVLLVCHSLSRRLVNHFLRLIQICLAQLSSWPKLYHTSYINFCCSPWLRTACAVLWPLLSCNNEIAKLTKTFLIRCIVLNNDSLKYTFLKCTLNPSDAWLVFALNFSAKFLSLLS